LRELLTYDPASGDFRWKARPDNKQFNSHFAGSIAGTTQSMGYRAIRVDGRSYLAHRMAFLYLRGFWPPGNVDHIDRDPANNAFKNLRSGSQSQNRGNSRRPCNNSTGKKGVYFRRDHKDWFAQIHHGGKAIYLGIFASAEGAQRAYLKAARRLFGEFACAG
jgi:hypothetical protein